MHTFTPGSCPIKPQAHLSNQQLQALLKGTSAVVIGEDKYYSFPFPNQTLFCQSGYQSGFYPDVILFLAGRDSVVSLKDTLTVYSRRWCGCRMETVFGSFACKSTAFALYVQTCHIRHILDTLVTLYIQNTSDFKSLCEVQGRTDTISR